MSRRGARNDDWVRIFEVPCFELHEKGYTVYKIVSRVFPCQCPEASTQVTVWKRFSEFSRLHKEMSSLHAALYLKGTFPPLAKASFFNRFYTAVMEDRRAEIRATLEFVALHPPLFTSAPFTRFFEDGDCRTVNEMDSLEPALSPQPSLTDSDVTLPAASDVTPPAAGDATPAPGALSGLDPLLSPEPAGTAGPACGPSNLQLLSEPPQPDLLSHLNSAPTPPTEEPDLSSVGDSGGRLPDLSWSEEGAGTAAAAAGLSGLTLDGAADPPELPSPPGSYGTPLSAATIDSDPAQPPPSPAPPREPAGLAPDAGRYLLTAADAISRAQEAESQCLWNLAFSHYQEGIGALINGVQGDPSAERREAVRRKTAMYIGRAEQLADLCRDTPPQVAAPSADTRSSGSPPPGI